MCSASVRAGAHGGREQRVREGSELLGEVLGVRRVRHGAASSLDRALHRRAAVGASLTVSDKLKIKISEKIVKNPEKIRLSETGYSKIRIVEIQG